MNLTNLSAAPFALGLAALAGLLFLLQRLRVRHRRVDVVTTLFWKEAQEEARARVLVRRFKHPWAWAFLVLIAGLLWLGFAGPRDEESTDRDVVVLVDASAGMARSGALNGALEAVAQRLRTLPSASRSVVLCGARSRTLLAPGEDTLLFDVRRESAKAQACPASVVRSLHDIVATRAADRPLEILLAGDAAIPVGALDALPDDVTVRRLVSPKSDARGNRGITALGVTAAASGAWDHVDILCEVRHVGMTGETRISATLGGRTLAFTAARTVDGNRERLLLADLPARGEVLALTIADGGDLALDDTAGVVLPNRPRIRVAVDASLRDRLGPVLESDPALVVTDGEVDCVIGTAAVTGVPSLLFVDDDSQNDAILLRHEADLASRDVLMRSFDELGLEDVDAMEVAEAMGRAVSIGAAPAADRSVSVWRSLLSDRFNFVQSRSFPLFVAKAIRWLAGVEDFAVDVAVGEVAIAGSTRVWTDEDGRDLNAAGGGFRPPRAGTYTSNDDRLVAFLSDPAATVNDVGAEIDTASQATTTSSFFDFGTGLGLIILLLLLVEWFFFRTGRMP